jgi:hypothetical protein
MTRGKRIMGNEKGKNLNGKRSRTSSPKVSSHPATSIGQRRKEAPRYINRAAKEAQAVGSDYCTVGSLPRIRKK